MNPNFFSIRNSCVGQLRLVGNKYWICVAYLLDICYMSHFDDLFFLAVELNVSAVKLAEWQWTQFLLNVS